MVRHLMISATRSGFLLMNTLRSAVDATCDDEGWASLGPVGAHITNQGPFDHRTYGFSKLTDLFKAIDRFEMKKVKHGNQSVYQVRQKTTRS